VKLLIRHINTERRFCDGEEDGLICEELVNMEIGGGG
jgi:hypothetical protein